MSLGYAWSYSSMSLYRQCPRRYYEQKVMKRFKETESEAIRWGNKVHKDLEEAISNGRPLPVELRGYTDLVDRLKALPGEIYTEQKLAVSASLAPTEWNYRTAWSFGILDYVAVDTEKAVVLDWKTGKRKPDSEQLKMFAGLTFSHYPEVQRVSTGFVWLKDNKIDSETYTRDQIPEIWGAFLPNVRAMEVSHEKDRWPAKPSGLCNGWCPVSSCEHWKTK